MNWNQLKYVMTVAEEKNISKAARRLYISQPSLSISISQLEKETGVKLFLRTGNSMELTYSGKLFCQWAEMVLYSQNILQLRFNELQVGTREQVVLGMSPHRSAVLTPAIVKKIHEQFPEIELKIVEKPNNELKVLLAEDKLDMIIDIPSSDSLDYMSEVIVDEEICLGVPKKILKDVLCGKKRIEKRVPGRLREIDLGTLKNVPFILLPEESYFGKMSRQALKEAGILPNVICECTFSETAKRLVTSGVGVAFLPDILAVHEHGNRDDDFEFFTIKGNKIRRTIAIVYRKEKHYSHQFKEIVNIFKECFLSVYKS